MAGQDLGYLVTGVAAPCTKNLNLSLNTEALLMWTYVPELQVL